MVRFSQKFLGWILHDPFFSAGATADVTALIVDDSFPTD
jgi:hypothetical protein